MHAADIIYLAFTASFFSSLSWNVCFGGRMVLAAVGADADGKRRVLAFREGSANNPGACKEVLGNLLLRSLSTDHVSSVVIERAEALEKAVGETFDKDALKQQDGDHETRRFTSRAIRRSSVLP